MSGTAGTGGRTAREVFDIAIHLMDAQNESTGATDTADTKEYRERTPSLLNSILDRAYPASEGYRAAVAASGGRRPVCPKVTGMEDAIALDERLCTGALPYGLAALLLTEEDPARSNFFWQTFLEQLEEAKRGLPVTAAAVEDTYGVLADTLEYGRFGRWLS